MINKVILDPDSVKEVVETPSYSYIRVFPKYEEDYVIMWEKKVLKTEDNTVESI
jgi:hypothetical protein